MAVFIADQNYIGNTALSLLRKYRCGFDKAYFKFDYFAMTDELGFAAIGNIVFIYRFEYGLPKYNDFLLSLIPKWADPIC